VKKRKIPGLNIQYPWTEFLLSGKKTIETRTYPIPRKYIGIELAMIETPAKIPSDANNPKTARIVGTIVFGEPFKYQSIRDWKNDCDKHLVESGHQQFSWKERQGEVWGWPVLKFTRLKTPRPRPRVKGIVFAKECHI